MTTYSFQAADGDLPTATEVALWKQDSRRALRRKGKPGRNLIRGHLASILNRKTLTNSTVSALLLTGALLTASIHA